MYKNVIKRVIDLVISLIGLPFLALVIVVFGLLIIIEGGGPVFYISQRAGKHGRTFKMYKLRSMKVNAPNLLNPDGSTFNSRDDDRQTRVGRLLRRTSMDETPQLINVLKGEMSLIGPRPVLDSQALTFMDEEKEKFDVLPGITGYCQAYDRNNMTSHDERMMDAWYAHNVSFLLDVKIFFKTIVTVLHFNDVYKNKKEQGSASVAVSDGIAEEVRR